MLLEGASYQYFFKKRQKLAATAAAAEGDEVAAGSASDEDEDEVEDDGVEQLATYVVPNKCGVGVPDGRPWSGRRSS